MIPPSRCASNCNQMITDTRHQLVISANRAASAIAVLTDVLIKLNKPQPAELAPPKFAPYAHENLVPRLQVIAPYHPNNQPRITSSWAYGANLGGAYSAGWPCFNFMRTSSQNGYGAGGTIGADDQLVAGVSDHLVTVRGTTGLGIIDRSPRLPEAWLLAIMFTV